jgi:hypothetical protein
MDGPIVLVVTGRNIDDELLSRAIEQPGEHGCVGRNPELEQTVSS